MKKIRFGIGILLGFALLLGCVACSNGNDDEFDGFNSILAGLNSGPPTQARTGLSTAQVNAIRDAVTTGTYAGWDDDFNGTWIAIWTGANVSDYAAVKAALENAPVSATVDGTETDDGNYKMQTYTYTAADSSSYSCGVLYTINACAPGGEGSFLLPAGTLMIMGG
jgi:hypothetical protein